MGRTARKPGLPGRRYLPTYQHLSRWYDCVRFLLDSGARMPAQMGYGEISSYW